MPWLLISYWACAILMRAGLLPFQYRSRRVVWPERRCHVLDDFRRIFEKQWKAPAMCDIFCMVRRINELTLGNCPLWRWCYMTHWRSPRYRLVNDPVGRNAGVKARVIVWYPELSSVCGIPDGRLPKIRTGIHRAGNEEKMELLWTHISVRLKGFSLSFKGGRPCWWYLFSEDDVVSISNLFCLFIQQRVTTSRIWRKKQQKLPERLVTLEIRKKSPILSCKKHNSRLS